MFWEIPNMCFSSKDIWNKTKLDDLVFIFSAFIWKVTKKPMALSHCYFLSLQNGGLKISVQRFALKKQSPTLFSIYHEKN